MGCCPMVEYHPAKMTLVWTTYLWRWGWHLIRPTMMTRTMMRWHLLVFLLISWLVFLLISWFSIYGATRPIYCLFVLLSRQTNTPFGTVLSCACLLLSIACLNESFLHLYGPVLAWIMPSSLVLLSATNHSLCIWDVGKKIWGHYLYLLVMSMMLDGL